MRLDPSWLSVIVAIIGILLIPALVIMLRGAIRWTKTEDQLATLVDDVRQLVENEDKVHAELLAQMRDDRAVTDKRLRFIEEFFMNAGKRAGLR